MINLDDEVHYQLNKLQSANLGSNVTGQIVMDCIVNPPKEGDASYELFQKVTSFPLKFNQRLTFIQICRCFNEAKATIYLKTHNLVTTKSYC